MRHERREALQTNELADHLGRAIETLRPYSNYVFIGLTVAVVGIIAAVTITGRTARSKASAWEALFEARTPEQLLAVATNYSDTPVAPWAMLQAAQSMQYEGATQLYDRRDQAVVRLKEAVKVYEQIAREHAAMPTIVERAAIGVAGCYETMGDLEAARAAYQQVVDRYAGRGIAKEAAERLARLNRPDATAFYEALAKYKPPPVTKPPSGAPAAPGAGVPLPLLDEPPHKSAN